MWESGLGLGGSGRIDWIFTHSACCVGLFNVSSLFPLLSWALERGSLTMLSALWPGLRDVLKFCCCTRERAVAGFLVTYLGRSHACLPVCRRHGRVLGSKR